MKEPKDELGRMKESNVLARNLNDEQLAQFLADDLKKIPKEGTKVIVLIGGPRSGKSILAAREAQLLGSTAVISTDNYVKGDRLWRRTNVEEKGLDPLLKYDPDFLNEQVQAIKTLSEGQELGIPVYDGVSGIAISQDPNHKPDNSAYPIKIKGPKNFVIIEGDFQLLDPREIDRLIYLDVDDKVRLENRVYRDTVERGEPDPEKIKANFGFRQKTQFISHTLPQRDNADIIIKVHAKPLETPTPETKFVYFYDVIRQSRAT